MKHYTSIEQSKRLIELGLGFNTADMSYPRELYLGESEYPVVIADDFKVDWTKALPCWSVAALLELMPKQIIYEEESCSPILLSYKNDWYACIYVNKYMEFAFDPIGDRETAIEACYEMVCWLLENKYI